MRRHGAGDCTRTIKGRTVAVCNDLPIRLHQRIGRNKSEAIGKITKKCWVISHEEKEKKVKIHLQ